MPGAPILVADDIVYQSNGSANVFVGIVYTALSTNIVLDGVVNDLIVGTTCYANTDPGVSGVVKFVKPDEISNTTIVVLHQLDGTFPPVSNTQIVYTNGEGTGVAYTVSSTCGVTVQRISGIFDADLPLSFGQGVIDIESANIRTEH